MNLICLQKRGEIFKGPSAQVIVPVLRMVFSRLSNFGNSMLLNQTLSEISVRCARFYFLLTLSCAEQLFHSRRELKLVHRKPFNTPNPIDSYCFLWMRWVVLWQQIFYLCFSSIGVLASVSDIGCFSNSSRSMSWCLWFICHFLTALSWESWKLFLIYQI